MEENQEHSNNIERVAFALFGSYKKSLVSLFILAAVLAIPITISLVQQQQILNQHAAGTDFPNGISLRLSPTSANASTLTKVSSAIGATTPPTLGYRRYIYKASATAPTPAPNTPSVGSYNPSSVQDGNIYAIDSSPTLNVGSFTAPQVAGTYFILVNAYNADTICDWSGAVWRSNNGSYIKDTSTSCTNSSKTEFVVSGSTTQNPTQTPSSNNPSVTAILMSPASALPGQNVTVTVAGTGGKEWVYLFMNSSAPNVQAAVSNPALYPSVQSYDPSSVTPGTFYKVGTTDPGGSIPVTLPSNIGSNNIYFVANAHSDPNNTSVTGQANDTVCAWEGVIFLSNGTQQACTNVGPQHLFISSGNPTGTQNPTGTPYPTNGQYPSVTQYPTNGPQPTTTQSPTGSTPTSSNQLAVSLQLPGIGTNTGDNKTPKHPTRNVELFIFNSEEQLVKKVQGQVTFDGTNTYKGNVDLGNDFQSGYYIVKVRMDNTLVKRVPGIQNIQASGVNTQPSPTAAPTSPPTTSNCPYPYPISLFLCRTTITSPGGNLPGQQNTNQNNGGSSYYSPPKTTATPAPTATATPTPTPCFRTANGNCFSGSIQGASTSVTTLPTVVLVSGDLDPNHNNILDIQDYNIFMSCYGDKQCSEKQQADFNDDGTVGGVDYQLLLRGFAIRSGD